jgi:hypothetical protein
MMSANFDECEAAGLDFKTVDRIAKRLERAGRDAAKLGLTVFGGAGSGSLRIRPDPLGPQLIIADINGGSWDGGDGAERYGDDGLKWGESH